MFPIALTVLLNAWVTAVLARWHRRLLLAMMLASPVAVIPAWAFGRATVGYARGTAVVIQRSMGAPLKGSTRS